MKHLRTSLSLPLVITLALALFSTSPARAAGPAYPARSPDGNAPAFAQGLWTLDLAGSYADPIRFSEDEFFSGTVGANYYVLDNLAIGLHLSGYGVDQPRDDGYGVGLEAWLRWHVLSVDRFTLFLDGGGGRAYFDPQTPDGGTRWNYTAKVGAGVTYQLDDAVDLMAGARYFHVSNGNQFERVRNPSYDSVQYFVGVTIRL